MDLNRREMLNEVTDAVESCGIVATAAVIEAEPRPLLLVLTIEKQLSPEQRRDISEELDSIRQKDSRLPQIVVLSAGMTLEAVLDPRVNHADSTETATKS